MSCVILGGLGFLGQNLSRALARHGEEVAVYARKSDRAQYAEKKLLLEGVPHQVIWGNFETETAWEEKLAGHKILFHLISTTKPSNTDLGYEYTSNVEPTVRMLEVCCRLGIKVIFFSSGGTVYGIPHYLPINEKHGTNPISTYGVAKLTIEKCLSYYGYAKGLSYIILRISNPYGTGQNPFGGQGLIGTALARRLRGEPIEIWGSGTVVRDYVYVDDLMEAVLLAAQYEGNYHVFNIGNGKGYAVNEVIEIIQSLLKPRGLVVHKEGRIQDVPVNILSHEFISEEMGWQPRTSLEEGIERMITGWQSNGNAFC